MRSMINNRARKTLSTIYGVACALLACGLLASAAPQARAVGIRVTINGSPVDFDGMGPIQINGRVLVPVRGVLESLGADVGWNEQTQTVVANNGHVAIELHLGDHSASVDGRAVDLDVPAQAIAGHTMVPLRFLSQALGAEVHWNEQARIVEIVTNRKDQPVNGVHRDRRDRRDGGPLDGVRRRDDNQHHDDNPNRDNPHRDGNQ